jgi:SAM-dependent methyltransferase
LVERHRHWFDDPDRQAEFLDWAPPSARGGLRVVERFDSEWHEFDNMAPAERARVFEEYFDLVPEGVAGARVLDAGCGGGRWSYELRRRGANVVAMDLGASVEQTARNGAQVGGIDCIQADVSDTPFRPGTFDLACVLGVLHHVAETESALDAVVATLRPGGRLLLYMYYALDDRPWWYRALYRVTDAMRRAISALPQGVARVITTFAAALIYWPLARLGAGLYRVGLARLGDALPLSFYRDLSFRTMRNDSLDRFGTSVEKRYTKAQVVAMMTAAGLSDVRVSPSAPYWHALGTRS